MSDATYAGAVIMEINGRDIEIVSLKPQTTTGRKCDGVTEHKLSVTAVIPIDGSEIDWAAITKAKITIYPINKEERRTSYLDCFTVEVSEQYETEGEAKIDIEMVALHKISE